MSVNLDMNLNGGGNKNDPNFEFIWEQYEKQARELKEYNDKSMEICPLPGLVIKTWLQSIEANPESGEPAVSFPDNEEGAKVG